MYFVYIMTNKSNQVLYTGSAKELELRVFQHKSKLEPKSFTSRYNINKLVWYQEYETYDEAFKRERRIKKWRRAWKVELIEKLNPNWNDLSDEWDLDRY